MCKTLKNIWKRADVLCGDSGASVVETTIIVPMILIIVMGVLLFVFFLLDMSIIKSETIWVANETASEWKKDTHTSISKERENLKKRIQNRLIMAHLKDSNVTISANSVVAKAEITYTLLGEGLDFSSTGKVSIDNRENWVRWLSP